MPAAGAKVSMGGPPPKGRLTCSALLCAMVAALGGLIFGYDIGGGGGAQVMLGFNWQFGPLATPPHSPLVTSRRPHHPLLSIQRLATDCRLLEASPALPPWDTRVGDGH